MGGQQLERGGDGFLDASLQAEGAKSRLKRVLKVGTTYLITLPSDFVEGCHYVTVTRLEEGLLIIKRIEDKEAAPTPEPPSRGSRRRAS